MCNVSTDGPATCPGPAPLPAAPYDDYALVVHARKDLYPHADVANEYNAVLGSTKIDTLVGGS